MATIEKVTDLQELQGPSASNDYIDIVDVSDVTDDVAGSSRKVQLGNLLPASGVTPGSYTNANITVNAKGQVTIASNGAGGGSGGISALTGDVTASGTGSVAATLANTAVNAGSYTNANITVDAKGRVTAAASGTASGGAVDLTSGVAGILPVANGGTGLGTIAASKLLAGNGTGAMTPVTIGSGLNLSGGTLSASSSSGNPPIPAGTNTFLPTTNQAATKPVQIARIAHHSPAGGGNVTLGYANWQTGSTGEQLAAPHMQGWNHYAAIEYLDAIYPVTFAGLPYGTTANGSFVVSDPVQGLHIRPNTTYYEFHVAVPTNYLSGSGVPSASLGSNGDTYYDNVGKAWYLKATGSWGSSLGTNPWLSNSYVVPVTHYTRAAFGEYGYQATDASRLYLDGSFPRGAKFVLPDISTGTLTFSGIGVRNGGQNLTWENSTPSLDILDMSEIGPGGGFGTAAAGFPNNTAGSVASLSATTASGSAYTGPLAINMGTTTQAWGASAISMVPDVVAPWVLMLGDSEISGVGSSDGNGDRYRQFGIYQRMLAKNGPPAIPSMNWGVAGLNTVALGSTMGQSRALFASLFSTSNSNVFISIGTNDYAGQSANGYLSTVKAATQGVVNYWKGTAGFRHAGLGTILPRTTSTDAFATETNQAPVCVPLGSGGDADAQNTQVVANTFVTGQDWYIDLRSWLQGTNAEVWKVSGAFTQSANGTTFPPTGDGIHPSKPLMVYSTKVNSFPSLTL